MPKHLPCPECGTQPITRRGYTTTTKHLWFAQCTNGIDCDLYPLTPPCATPAEALASWNRGEAFPQDEPEPAE